MKRIISFALSMMLILSVTLIAPTVPTTVSAATVSAPISSDYALETDRDYYLTGDSVTVTATGKTATDWVGIKNKWGSTVLASAEIGAANTATQLTLDTSSLGAGDYEVFIMPGGKTFTEGDYRTLKAVKFSAEFAPVKSVYKQGEPLMLRGSGDLTNTPWMGIRPVSGPEYSMYICHLNSENAGTELNIGACGSQDGFDGYYDLPVGMYEVYYVPAASSNYGDRTISYFITITTSGEHENLSVEYDLTSMADGLASGTVTVTAEEGIATHFRGYWTDEHGVPLASYEHLAPFEATGTTTVYTMPNDIIIPEGAGGLKIVTLYLNNELGSYGTVTLPADSAFDDPGKPIYQFAVVSDTHTHTDIDDHYCNQVRKALTQIKAQLPTDAPIFINGDVTNNGLEVEYTNLQTIITEIYGTSAPQIFTSIGNHDGWGNNTSTETAHQRFAKWASVYQTKMTVSDVYYDYWVGDDYHFIITGDETLLGTDSSVASSSIDGLNAIMSDTQLDWLDAELAESEEKGAKSFVFCHQGLYNTVAGTGTTGAIGNVSGDDSNDSCAQRVRSIFANYCDENETDIYFFNSHTHASMEYANNYVRGDDSLPNTFNTASVAYIHHDLYGIDATNYWSQSQGYIVKVYDDKVMLFGRNFRDSKWIPNATYCIYTDYGYTVDTDITSGSGTVVAENAPDNGKFNAGDTVNLAITPAAGYEVSSVSVNGTSIDILNDGAAATYSFTCPEAQANVRVGFTVADSTMLSEIDNLYPDVYAVLGTDEDLSTSEYLTDSAGTKHYYAKFANGLPIYSANQNYAQSYKNMQKNGYSNDGYLPHVTYYLYAPKDGVYNTTLNYSLGSANNSRWPISDDPYFALVNVNGQLIKGTDRTAGGSFNEVFALSLKKGINEVNIITICPENYAGNHRWMNIKNFIVPSNLIGIKNTDIGTQVLSTESVTDYKNFILYDDGRIGVVGNGATKTKNAGLTFENITYQSLSADVPYITMSVTAPYSGYYDMSLEFNFGVANDRTYIVMFVDGGEKQKVSLFASSGKFWNSTKLAPVYLTKGTHTITITNVYNCKLGYPTHDGYATWSDFGSIKMSNPNIDIANYKFGDITDNGTIDADDLALMQRALLEDADVTLKGSTLADINCSGETDIKDLLRLKLYLADSSTPIGPQ